MSDKQTTDYVSPNGGVSYGLEYPFRYKEDGPSWVIFSTLDGWVLERIGFASVLLEIPSTDNWQQRYFSEQATRKRCREANGLNDHVSADVLAEMDAQE